MAAEPQGPSVAEGDEEVRRSWRWRRRLVRVRRVLKGGFGIILLVTLIGVGLLSQTGRGQDLALRTVLDRVRSSLAGELIVVGVRSGTLLTGATLTGVRLDAADGRRFLTADSVVIRYSLLSAIFGGSPVRSTTLWGADIEISQHSPGQAMNLDLLLADGDDDDDASASPPRSLGLGHIAIRQGQARVRTPATGSTRARIVTGPQGQRLRELSFDDLDLDVEEVVLTPGAPVAFEARLASFSSSIAIVDQPLVVREIFGVATFGDQGLRVTDAAFRLPRSLLEGDLTFGPNRRSGGWSLSADLTTDGWGDLSDVEWIDTRIPEGRFRGRAALTVADGLELDLGGLEVELEASSAVFDGGVTFADRMSLRGMEVTASPISLSRLEPWIGRTLPLDGWLSGQATFTGTLDDITTEGHVTLVPTGYGGGPVTADFAGAIHRGIDPGATDFSARATSLNYTVLEAFWPELSWEGTGSGTVRLDGRLDTGLSVEGDFEHLSRASVESAVGVRGLVRRADGDELISELDVELRPLALELLAETAPELGLQGELVGPVRIDGPWSELSFVADLATRGGRLGLEGTIDANDPASGYALRILADSVAPAMLSTRLTNGTMWTGEVVVDGSGFSPDSARLSATLAMRDSRAGALRVDTIAAQIRIEDGVLITDSLHADIGGVTLDGRGRFGLLEGRWGASRLDFTAPSLVGLRSWLMGIGDSILVQDGLSELDREFLRAQGIEPDTLPNANDVRLEGTVAGAASISGAIDNFDLGVIVEVAEGRYKQNEVDSARVAFTANGLPAFTGSWQIGASANGILLEGREFEQGGFEADMFAMDGEGRIEIVRRPGEQYRAVGSFSIDSVGGEVDVSEASVQIEDRLWRLTRPARVAWDEATVVVDSVEVARGAPDPMHMIVNGTLTRGGESDFRLFVEGLHIDEVLHVTQVDEVAIGGHVNADLSISGTASAPQIDGTFQIDGPSYGSTQLTRISGSIVYDALRASVDLEGHDGIRPVLSASGSLPLDLRLAQVEQRVLDAPMDVRVRADSLDAAIALSYLSTLEGVVGWVSGDVTIRGTPESPEPEGLITLSNAAWTIEEIGVRHAQVNGELRLRPDRTVDVALSTRGNGFSEVGGTVLLEPVRDPELDLDFTFGQFLAVSRPDVEGLISGRVNLGGSYRRPVASGELTVDEGVIYVDELQRAVGVVDLSDPFLFDIGLAVDTTALATQPLLAGFGNPFFDNLRVDVDLSVPRGSWLRSVETNVEMSGDLLVRYDRSAGDFVLIGELEAVRGSHQVLGRTFELDVGTVSFIGRPGLNPDLDILASSRIRRPNDAPIDVNAQVGGTLVRPVVTLSSEEAGMAQEDLVSYLIFGQPSGALGRGALVDANRGLGASAVGAGLTFVGGFAGRLGSVLAQEVPLIDYVSFQQGSTVDFETLGREAQLEVGWYAGDDVFVILVLRPGTEEQNQVPGVRVEWALTDDYNVEGFMEDRFLRSGSSSFATSSGLSDSDRRIWGIFLFREWGYGRGGDPQE